MANCQICGRQPAAEINVRRHVGMIVLQRFVQFRGNLCREHGIAVAKDFLGKTLVQGWWGLISFFVNFYAIATDLSALSKAKKLPAPIGAPAYRLAPGQSASEAQPQAAWSDAPPLPPPPLPTR